MPGIDQLFRRIFMIGLLLGIFPEPILPIARRATAAEENKVHSPLNNLLSAGEVTAEVIVAKLVERNRLRELQMQQMSYSAPRTYRIKDEKGKLRTEAQVLMQYRAPGAKEFKILSKTGSDLVFGRVLKPLMENEVEAAAGHKRQDNSISLANYNFALLGEEDIHGYHCFLLQANPKRADKFLFKGKIWVHATEYAVVQIAGQPAKSPSMMIKRVDFIRRYQKVGDFWLPLKDESTTQVRFVGTNFLTIDYERYDLALVKNNGKK